MYDRTALVRVIVDYDRNSTIPTEERDGVLVEVPARQARPGQIVGGARVVRPAWPYEYDLDLGAQCPMG